MLFSENFVTSGAAHVDFVGIPLDVHKLYAIQLDIFSQMVDPRKSPCGGARDDDANEY